MQSTTGIERMAGGRGDDRASAARTRRWRRALAGYTANVTTYVAAHVMPGRLRAPVAADATMPSPAIVVAPVAPPTAAPRVATEHDRRWPAHVVSAVARILVALAWAMGDGGRGRRGR